MTANRRIFLNIVATYGRSLFSLASGLFISRWVLAALGKVDFGLYGVVGGLAVFVTFINLLLSQATARFYAFSVGRAKVSGEEGLEDCRRWFNTAVFIHTVVPCVLIAVGYPLGVYAVEHWLTIPADRMSACIWVFRYVCISCFIGMLNVPFGAMYTAKQEIAELTVYSFAQTLVNLCFMYFMVTHPGDWLERYALWMCAVSVVPQLIICVRAVKVYPECKYNRAYLWSATRVRQLGAFACWQAFGGLGFILRGQGIQILINKYFGPTINGSMAIANQVSGSAQTLSSALQGAFAPAITNSCGAGDLEQMRAFAYRTCKFGMLLALIFVLPLALELRTVIQLWLGDPPAYAVELCWYVLIMAIIDKSSAGHMLAVSATGKIAAYQTFLGGSLILTLPLAWIFVALKWGVCSVGWAMIATMLVCAWGRVWFARSIVGMSARYWLRRIMLPVVVLLLVCFAVGCLPRLILSAGVLRLGVTTVMVEAVLLPLAFFVVLDAGERQFVLVKIRKVLGR